MERFIIEIKLEDSMIKVSIIIPVYNVELYLNKCLNSCVNQTLKEIEIIVINDASPDKSDKIMNQYAQKYPEKIINIFLKENLKQGGARNIGINKAQGKYLCFVDGDDYIDKKMCEKLYIKGELEQLDIVCCNGYYVNKNKQFYWEKIKYYDTLSKTHLQNFTGQCYMIIRREVIVKDKLFYPEHIFTEDCAIVPLWYLKAKKIGLIEEALYYQTLHDDSTSSIINFESTLYILESINILILNAKKIGMYNIYKEKIDCFILIQLLSIVKRIDQQKRNMTFEQICNFELKLKNWINYVFDYSLVLNFLTEDELKIIYLFIHNFKDFLGQDWKVYQENIIQKGYSDKVTKKVITLLNNFIDTASTIVVWGVGQRGLVFIGTLKRLGIKYIVVDNNEKKWNQQIITGDVVRNLDWVENNVEKAIFLITATRYYKGIVKQILAKFDKPIVVDIFSYIVYDNYEINIS